jgi:glutamine amidotransferase
MLIIVDYGVGNLTSILNMLKKGSADARISSDPAAIAEATKLLLPGMGHFDNCMLRLKASGLLPVIEQKVFNEKAPILGICVGLQMLMRSSEEGTEPGLGWVNGRTIRFQNSRMRNELKIPNMGWLEVHAAKHSPLLQGLDDARFYFAHSFHIEPEDKQDILLTAEYGYSFAVSVEKDNIIGVQFHPEKSHRFGMQLLQNFANNYR